MEHKEWWQSKSIWAALIIAAVAIAKQFGLDIPTELVISLAGAFGIIGLRSAIDQK